MLAVAVAVELILLGLYLAFTPAELTRLRYALYPFVWINVSLLAVDRVDPPAASPRRVLLAGTVAVVYLVVLFVLAGLVGVDPGGNPAELVGLSIGYGTPGWERVRLVLPGAHLTLVPFRAVGYLALAYLVYVTALEATVAALSGALGFVSCLSCSFPILTSFAAASIGGSAPLVGTLYAYSLDISTAVFVLSVALLYYRPGFDRAGGADGGEESHPRAGAQSE